MGWMGGACGVALVLLGCGDDTQPVVDAAALDAPGLDAATADADPQCMTLPGQTHTIYLAFEGVMLHPCPASMSGCSDATTGTTNQVMADVMVPPFLNGVSDRQIIIDQAVMALRQQLAPYAADVVTTRPSAGGYIMIALGGDCPSITGGTAAQCGGSIGYQDFDCDNLLPNDVALVFDSASSSGTEPVRGMKTANTIMNVLGFSLGLVYSTPNGDCLKQAFPLGTSPCTLSPTAPVDTRFNICADQGTTQDEPAAFKRALGCR